jgi:hypothetical protein
MFGRYLPNWLYAALPFAYLVAALFGILGTDPLFGKLCGALLFTAALLILDWRHGPHRRE